MSWTSRNGHAMSRYRPTDEELIRACSVVLPRIRLREGSDDPAVLLRDKGIYLPRPRRKKIRGWRRRMRELERWIQEEVRQEPMEHLAADARIRFDMWWPIPRGVQRRMVEGLVWIHDQWRPRMQRLHEETGIPTYVGLWLRPRLYDSGAWASIGEDALWHRQRHEVPQPSGMAERVGPPAEFHTPTCDLSRFEWTHWVTTWNELLTDFSEEHWPAILHGAYRIERVETDDGPNYRVHWTTHDYYGWIRPG